MHLAIEIEIKAVCYLSIVCMYVSFNSSMLSSSLLLIRLERIHTVRSSY